MHDLADANTALHKHVCCVHVHLLGVRNSYYDSILNKLTVKTRYTVSNRTLIPVGTRTI